jgi:ferredoxin/flavodoxin---NADP+ reductase
MRSVNNMETSNRVNTIIQSLNTHSVESVTKTLAASKALSDLTFEEKLDLTKALSDVFFHVHHTGSTEMPKLAVNIEKQISRFGPEMIPFLFKEILEADTETAVYFGKSLARNGVAALDFIVSKLADHRANDHDLINIVQVFSFFKIPEVTKAIPVLLQEARHSNHQVTAMSLYSVGRLVLKLRPTVFSEELRSTMFDSVFRFLAHTQGLVRKNAARTLGKMLRKGLLSSDNEQKLYKTFLAITGRDEHHNWDRAFIVRREAEDFLPYFCQSSLHVRQYSQSYKILSKRLLCANTFHFTIDAPLIARKIEGGQFLIIRPHILSERIPLSVCGWNRDQGSIDIVVSAVGKTTTQINAMEKGDFFEDVVGPLGERSILPSTVGTCVVIGGGYGTGAIIPTAKDMKALGNKVIGIVGARNQDSLIMIPELSKACDEVMITTNDGSAGLKGLVTDALQQVLEREKVIYVLAVGPVPMMKAVSEMTRPHNINTYVSLNAIMVDGTGMCGACRVTVGGETKFACFHGPDFDGHQVDFENLTKRQKMFAKQEKMAFDQMHN